jgi:YkoY family integral membrane protein
MHNAIQSIINEPVASLLVICNLILIESLLSIDNAAVLGTMVMGLKPDQRKRALKYGIVGAYVFRGVCLLLASTLIKIWWLKSLGGIYLLYLAVNWARMQLSKKRIGGEHHEQKEANALYRYTLGRLGKFWATVVTVELMDLAFSIDNVFAAVAFSENIILILCGVFIGILAMRFVAQGFVKLMERFPFLESCAYLVISLLGIKLTLSLYEHYYPDDAVAKALTSEYADWLTSGLTLCIFLLPVISSLVFNVPKKHE